MSEAEGSRPRIFVGDVQGCADELDELVSRANAAFGDDFALWCSGDLINRGPDNRRPLELMRRLIEEGRGEYILGNHEITFLAVALGLREPGPNDSFGDLLAAPDAAEWLDWVRARPLTVPGRIADQPFAMVHAASHPDWSLADLVEAAAEVQKRLSGSRSDARAFLASDPAEDPVRDHLGLLTRCRSVTPDGVWSSDEPVAPAVAWHRAWAQRRHEHGLVYGHWAMQGLHVATGLRGLDTGCVHHGRGKDGFLTAWLPESMPRADGRRPFDLPDDRFWQIAAKRRYYFPAGDVD